MDKYNDLIKKIDFADECNKDVAGNFERKMTITMSEAFLCKQLLEEKVVNEKCNLQSVIRWVCFNDKIPNYGDLIVVEQPPEAMTQPYLTVFDRNMSWLDGDCYIVIKPCV